MPLAVRSLDLWAVLFGAPIAALSVYVALVALPPSSAIAASVAAVSAQLLLAFRLSWPRLAFAGVAACLVVLALTTGLFLGIPSVLAFPVALHAATAYGERVDGVAASTVGVLGAGFGTWRFVTDEGVRGEGLEPHPGFVLVTLLAVVAAAWALGQRTRGRIAAAEVDRQRTRERIAATALTERTRIAVEMHDVVAHSLAVIVSQARGGQYAARADPDASVATLATIERTGREALQEMRGILGLLRDGRKDGDLAPVPALADLPDLVARFPFARLTVAGTARPLFPARELAGYRAVQESLTNVFKHAGPGATAEVTLAWSPDRLLVTVTDDGAGAPTGEGEASSGVGLAGMRYRVEAVGGTATAGPRADGGFSVTVSLPVERTSSLPERTVSLPGEGR